ncbi:MAG TPA: hypothetical protein VMV81_12325, partial [Phycisphaerae bacterium]|nr:hypothetical protein [Phycisphaerae bacterium]
MQSQRLIVDFGDLALKRPFVERGQLLDLSDKRVDLRTGRTGRQLIAKNHELRKDPGRELVVNRVAQRFELGIGRLNTHRHGADLLNLAQIFAYEVALLQLVRQQEIPVVVEFGSAQVSLEEAGRRRCLVLDTGEAAERPQPAQF